LIDVEGIDAPLSIFPGVVEGYLDDQQSCSGIAAMWPTLWLLGVAG
jgi:hypothetical protein